MTLRKLFNEISYQCLTSRPPLACRDLIEVHVQLKAVTQDENQCQGHHHFRDAHLCNVAGFVCPSDMEMLQVLLSPCPHDLKCETGDYSASDSTAYSWHDKLVPEHVERIVAQQTDGDHRTEPTVETRTGNDFVLPEPNEVQHESKRKNEKERKSAVLTCPIHSRLKQFSKQ